MPDSWKNPTSYALKETAKEMWNSKEFVPFKRKLLDKLRAMGPDTPHESPNLSAATELAAYAADQYLPDNPTQLAAGLVGGRVAGKAIRGAAKLGEKGLEKLQLNRIIKNIEPEEAFQKRLTRSQEAKELIRKGVAEDADEAEQMLSSLDVFD